MADELNLPVTITGDPDSAARAMDAIRDRSQTMASSIVGDAAKMVAGYVSVKAALDAIGAGIRNADDMRDLSNSLAVYTGSVENATAATEFFEVAADQTRHTGDELAKIFRDVLPTSISRGFSQESAQQITVWLSQLSTISGKSVASLQSGWEQMLSGTVNAKNELLRTLGFTKADMDGLKFEEVAKRMADTASHFPEFGDSFESAMAKVKDSWSDAFGAGFNQTMNAGRDSITGIRSVMEDPQFLGAVNDVGGAVAGLVIHVRDLVVAYRELKRENSGGAGSNNNGFMQGITDAIVGPSSTSTWDALFGGGNLTDLTKSHQRAFRGNPLFPTLGGDGPRYEGSSASSSLLVDSKQESESERIKRVLEDAARAGQVAAEEQRKAAEELRKAAAEAKRFADSWVQAATTSATTASVLHARLTGSAPVDGGLSILTPAGWGPGFNERLPQSRTNYAAMMGLSPEVMSAVGGEYLPQRNHGFPQGFLTPGDAKDIGEKIGDGFRDAAMNAAFINDFAFTFAGVVRSGGRDFVEILTGGFDGLIQQSAKDFAERIFGRAGDGQKGADGQYLPGHDPTRLYDGSGKDITGRATVGRGLLAGAEVVAGGYSAGYSGQDGSRTSSALGGAMTGYQMFGGGYTGIVGAILGGLVGFGSALYGEKQAQKDYSYGIPGVDSQGRASLSGPRNLNDTTQREMVARIQETFDTIHDAYIFTLLKLPDAILPAIQAIDGKFQDNPSSKYLKHFDEWINGTLPREIADQFKGGMQTAFEGIGLGSEKFNAVWEHLDRIDPKKAALLWGSLADSLVSIDKTSTYFHKSFGENFREAGTRANMSPGAMLAEKDDAIIRLWNAMGSLSTEGQIANLERIASLQNDRYEMERAAIQELYNLAESAKNQFRDFFDNIALQGMVKADGTPDHYAQAQFYRQSTNTALSEISRADTAEEANRWLQNFFRNTNAAMQAGIQADPSKRQEWLNWGRETGRIGQAAFDNTILRIGKSIDTVNASFTSRVDPALNSFTGKVNTSGAAVGNFGDALNKTIMPINNVAAKMGELAGSIDNAIARINAAGGGGSSDTRFEARTAAARVAR